MRRHAHTRRGFATFTAVLMVGLVGMALAMTASLFAQEARRTAQQRTGAQLRQLLLAGGAWAQDRLAGDPVSRTEDLAPTLPGGLADLGAWLTIRLRPGDAADRCVATVVVGYDRRVAEQRIVLAREAGVWRIVAAQVVGQRAQGAGDRSGR
jgi:hypothetical protein